MKRVPITLEVDLYQNADKTAWLAQLVASWNIGGTTFQSFVGPTVRHEHDQGAVAKALATLNPQKLVPT